MEGLNESEECYAQEGNLQASYNEETSGIGQLPSNFVFVSVKEEPGEAIEIKEESESLSISVTDVSHIKEEESGERIKINEESKYHPSPTVSCNKQNKMDSFSFYGESSVLSRAFERELNKSDSSNESDGLEEVNDLGSDVIPGQEEMEILLHDEEEHVASQSTPQTTSTQSKASPSRQSTRKGLWRNVGADNSSLDIPVWRSQLPTAECVRRPIEYFRDFFSEDIIDHLVYQSNLYALQKNPNKPLQLTNNELEQFWGILFAMSLVKLSYSRLYWSSQLQCSLVSESMTRDRWEEIKSNLHCNDDSKMPLKDDSQYDKLYKVRPLITHLQNKYRKIPMPQVLCVDEQIVTFKGLSNMKQYIPFQSHKWGYKIFSLCDTGGIQYDFEVYDGNMKPVRGEPDIGPTSNIVLQLAKCIPTGVNHLICFDNWCTSLPLITTLAKKKIYSLGTVRQCRLPGISFPSDKDLMKRGRGSYVEVGALVDDVDVRAVKWADNRCVSLVSSFSSAQPMKEVKRCDKKKKAIILVPCPTIVTTFNKFMGGMDLMDSLITLYKINTRCKKYYHKLIFHFLDVALVNSWLLFRRDSKHLGVPERKMMMLQEFKMSVAKALILEGKRAPAKRETPSTSSNTVESMHASKKQKGHATKMIPGIEIRSDGVDHLPEVAEKGGRCKKPGCNGITVFFCTKCKVNLCLTKARNCYKEFHTK